MNWNRIGTNSSNVSISSNSIMTYKNSVQKGRQRTMRCCKHISDTNYASYSGLQELKRPHCIEHLSICIYLSYMYRTYSVLLPNFRILCEMRTPAFFQEIKWHSSLIKIIEWDLFCYAEDVFTLWLLWIALIHTNIEYGRIYLLWMKQVVNCLACD